MKAKVLVLVSSLMLLIITGCATPSKVVEKFKNGEIVERITEYDNSTFFSGKAIGLTVGVNPETKIPEVILRYGRYESARIKNDMWYDSDYKLNNINLFTGEGSALHHIRIGPKELYLPLVNKEE